jgi:23S rRNA G2445 N2-methylase RlmL
MNTTHNERTSLTNLSEPKEFFISCPSECEELLLSEVEEQLKNQNLSPKMAKINKGGVYFRGTFEEVIRTSVYLRTASRVFWIFDKIYFKDEQDFYNKSLKTPWEHILHPKKTFKIDTATSGGSRGKVRNTHFMSLKLKDALVDSFRNKGSERPSVEKFRPNILIKNKIVSSNGPLQAQLHIDLFGIPLSNRGYRVPGHEAPLRENLAAAIALNMPKVTSDMAVIDSMSGSGTFLIETFLLKNKISPQFLRIKEYKKNREIWSFNHFPVLFKNRTWMDKINRFLDEVSNSDDTNLENSQEDQFYGHDIDFHSINVANDNLKKAGLINKVSVKKSDGTKIDSHGFDQGIVFCNPPYGERLGEIEDLEELYYQYGENLKSNFKGFSAYIFTGNQDLRKKISLRTSKRIKLYNGPLECRLIKYELY